MYQIDRFSFSSLAARRSSVWIGMCLLSLLVFAGCSKDEMKKMANTVQQSTQDFAAQSQEYIQGAVEVVEEQLPSSGSLSLKLEPSLDIESASVELIDVGDGRSKVVQLATYDTDSDPAKFPCVLLHGQTQAGTADELVGETVACDLYVQQSSGGAIFMTPAGGSIQVTFGHLDEKSGTLKASIGSGRLISSDQKKVNLNGGNAVALVKRANG